MAKIKSLSYYLGKVPHIEKETEPNSFDDAIEYYKKWKLDIVAYYEPDKKLKKEFPEVYQMLITKEITDEEMEKLKEEYKQILIVYSDKLSSAEYELD